MGFFKRRIKKTKETVTDAMELGIFFSVFGMVKDIFLTIFMPWKKGEPAPVETFEEAVKRMRLSEQDLEDRKKLFLRQTLIYLGVAFLVAGYGVYLAFQQSLMGMSLSLVVAALSFSYAFRSHFWLFQVKQKKLGCTFKEYLNSSVKGEK